MDRKAWISITLCVVGLFAWQWWYARTYGDAIAEHRRLQAEEAARRAPSQDAAAAAAPASQPATFPSLVAETTPSLTAPPLTAGREPEARAAREEIISTTAMRLRFTSLGGGIREVRLTDHLAEGGEFVPINEHRPVPIGDIALNPDQFAMTEFGMRLDGSLIHFERDYPEGVVARKIFTTPDGAQENQDQFLTRLKVIFENTSAVPVEIPGYFVNLGSIVPIHSNDLVHFTGFHHHRAGKTKFIDVNWFRAGQVPLLGIQTRPARSSYLEEDGATRWAAVTNQYFTSAVTVLGDTPGNGAWARRFDVQGVDGERPKPGIEGAIAMPGVQIAPGGIHEQEFEIYTGPKKFRWLREFGHGQEEILRYGMFKWISLTLLNSLNALYAVLGNYALAIIVLTLVIKTLLWPLQNKATGSMRKMAALSPKMTELREKYKDDPTRMNQEVMKLYKEYGVNPFGGCLPMLVQIPIFFGFYSMLGTAVELRNSGFLWVRDLSQPDTIARLFETIPINLLPLVMAGTMLWQMRITPKTGDKVQQRIFMFLPLIFLVFCYNFASALALYWTVQNLFSVVQLYLTRDKPLPAMTKVKPAEGPAAPGSARRKKKSNPNRPR